MLKGFRVVFSLLLIFGFSATLVGKEETDTYFPVRARKLLGLRGSGWKQINTPCRRDKND